MTKFSAKTSSWQFCVKTIVFYKKKIQKFTMKTRNWRKNLKKVDKLTMLRKILFTTKKLKKIYE